jgi:uncharacterized membrane protein YedE/YeeE
MKNLKYLLIGTFFGLVLTKGEAISWYRMQEMFRFESFHMFGIFMTAIPVGALSLFIIRKFSLKTIDGSDIEMPKKVYHSGIIFGSLIFGFGWALTGACPGPIYAQIGTGSLVTIVTLVAALGGALSYEYLKKYLPE